MSYKLPLLRSQKKQSVSNRQLESFDFRPGRLLAGGKYEVVTKIGEGWESEVYMLRETQTGIESAGKFFFPHRNSKNKPANIFAQKLHKLRGCQSMVRYLTQEKIRFRGQTITFLVSDFLEGEVLSEFFLSQPGGRLRLFEGLQLLHAVASALKPIHKLKEFHGDIHADNVIVAREGVGFRVKLLDPYVWKASAKEVILDDVCNLIKIFYDSIGGAAFYGKMPKEVKTICCGLRRAQIRKNFRNCGELVEWLEKLSWQSSRFPL
jgi:serine/threonine protein kinase